MMHCALVDATASAWGAWGPFNDSSVWSGTGAPPTTGIDAFMLRPVFATGSTLVAPAPPSSSTSKPAPLPQSLGSQTLPLQTRVITYAYDGLQRLTAANESPGTNYAYAYDDAGNRTGVWLNGTRTVTQTFNATLVGSVTTRRAGISAPPAARILKAHTTIAIIASSS